MTILRRSLYILLTYLLSGCAYNSGFWRVDDIKAAKTGESDASTINLDDVLNDAKIGGFDGSNRNDVVSKLIRLSDQVCEEHKSKIIANGSTANFLASATATALSGISAITTGIAARNLAAGSSITTATTAEYNSNIYYGVIAPAIIREINRDRAAKLTALKTNFEKKITAYPINSALSDALAYHYSCSFYNGLILVTADKTKAALTFDEIKSRIKTIDEQIDKINNINPKPTIANEVSNLEAQKASLNATRLMLLNQLQGQAAVSLPQ